MLHDYEFDTFFVPTQAHPLCARTGWHPWLRLLQPHERDRAVNAIHVTQANPGEYVCMIGRQVTYWFGLIDGLLKMSSENAQGVSMTFAGLPLEGGLAKARPSSASPTATTCKRCAKSVVAGLHIDTFHWLLDNSLGFNRYIMNQLNERLGQFIGAREIDRLSSPDLRVARSLAALFNPALYPYPGGNQLLRITQQELAYLVGLSRQRVNEALATLEAAGAIQVEYGGLRVVDLEALRNGFFQSTKSASAHEKVD